MLFEQPKVFLCLNCTNHPGWLELSLCFCFREQPYWLHRDSRLYIETPNVEGAKGAGNEASFPKGFIVNTYRGLTVSPVAVFQVSDPFKGLWLHRCGARGWQDRCGWRVSPCSQACPHLSPLKEHLLQVGAPPWVSLLLWMSRPHSFPLRLHEGISLQKEGMGVAS